MGDKIAGALGALLAVIFLLAIAVMFYRQDWAAASAFLLLMCSVALSRIKSHVLDCRDLLRDIRAGRGEADPRCATGDQPDKLGALYGVNRYWQEADDAYGSRIAKAADARRFGRS